MKLQDYLHLYIGCNTTKGKLVGIKQNICFIEVESGEIIQFDLQNDNEIIKPILRRLRDMSAEESSVLVEKGFSIGRPNGYSFSSNAILYLLSKQIDLFSLLENGLAIDQKQFSAQ
jgi:hypothetical protein